MPRRDLLRAPVRRSPPRSSLPRRAPAQLVGRLLRRLAAAAGALLGTSVPLHAQGVSAQCPAGAGALTPERVTQDACQKSVDLFQLLAPQLGAAVAGGNVGLGQSGALGGPGHFGLSIRASGLRGNVPQFDANCAM